MTDTSILTAAQIAYYAQAAGFSGNDLNTAVAIALAESGGRPVTYNPETAAGTPDGEGSYGLWQIYLHAHPEYAYANLYDPQTNANAAYALYQSAGGFSPWATYNSGAYVAFLTPAATEPAPTPTGMNPPVVSAASMIPTGFSWESVIWIGAAILAGLFTWNLLE